MTVTTIVLLRAKVIRIITIKNKDSTNTDTDDISIYIKTVTTIITNVGGHLGLRLTCLRFSWSEAD